MLMETIQAKDEGDHEALPAAQRSARAARLAHLRARLSRGRTGRDQLELDWLKVRAGPGLQLWEQETHNPLTVCPLMAGTLEHLALVS